MTTGKTLALTKWTFVDKVMSMLFNMLSRLVITFLPRSKCLNLMAEVTICSDFGAAQNKVCHCFHCFTISNFKYYIQLLYIYIYIFIYLFIYLICLPSSCHLFLVFFLRFHSSNNFLKISCPRIFS